MNGSIFTEFYSEVGHKTYSSESADWIEIQRGMLLSVPFHRTISPSEAEIDRLIARAKVLGVRFPTQMDGFGFQSSRVMCRKTDYGMGDLTSKARNQVRKGEANFEIRGVSPAELLNDGLNLNRKTFARQNREDPKSDPAVWGKICRACSRTAGVKVFGAFHDNRLAAYMIVLETPTAAEIIIQNSDSDMLKLCPNNILAFTVTRDYLAASCPALPVCYGLGSLEVTQSLDHFKQIMGYELEPIRQRLVFSRTVRPFLNRGTLGVLNLLQSRLFEKSYFFRKCQGMLTCYLNQTDGSLHV